MYAIIRLILTFIIFGCLALLFRKNKKYRKRVLYIVFASMSVFFYVVSMFFPFENLLVSFDSPKSAYEYYSFDRSKIELVVEGEHCDFLVARKGSSETYLILPKTEDGWKIGIGSHTKRIVQQQSDEVVVYVYQYKNTSDYFVTIFSTSGGELTVSDDSNTEFFALERKDDVLGSTFVTYYGHIANLTSQHCVTVNGNEIML